MTNEVTTATTATSKHREIAEKIIGNQIGAGSRIGLHEINFVAKGLEATAFEPQTSGFTDMHKMRDYIASNWRAFFHNLTSETLRSTTQHAQMGLQNIFSQLM